MLIRCGHVVRRSVRQMRRRGMLHGPIDAAIDMHKIGRYDRRPDMTNMIKSKSQNGICNFNCLETAQCVVGGSRATLGAILATRADFKADIVARLLEMCGKDGIVVNLLTLDREFFTREIVRMPDERGIRFLMPATKHKGVKKAIAQYEKRGPQSPTTSSRQRSGLRDTR